jgi:L1 cell adhesion molecule like protein
MKIECFQKNYTTKLDVYSYGILMNEVFSEERPWSHLSDTRWNSEIHDRVDQGQRPRMNFSEVQYAHASEIKNIITCCWAGNPTTRPTMSHVVQMLNHLLEACAIANNKTKFSMTPCVGIAFGSSTCAVSYNHPNGNTELIPNAQGNRKTPCYVAFTDTGVLTGDMAKSQITRNASNTVYDILLLVGRYYSDPVIQQRIPTWPFTVINHTNFPMVQVEHQNQRKNFTPEELMAILLKQLKHDAETYLNITVPLAVISIPSSFSMLQRQCILDAGQIAGLSFERILPASNVVPLTMGTKVGESLRLICDLGASTCEISLIIFDDTVYEVRENCSESVGGDDFDARMMQHFISEFERRFHIPHREICTNKRAIQRLRIACERAKQTLSSSNNAAIELPSWYDGIDFYSRISRQTFQQINYDLFQRVMNPIVAVAEKNKSSIDEIVLIGGSSRVPYVQELIQDYFNGKSLSKRLHPDEAPALGLALQAGIVSGYNIDDLILLVTPRTIGFTDLNGNKTPVVNLNTTIPTLKSQEIPSTIVSAGIVQVYEEDPAIHTPRIVGEADLKSLSLSGTLTIFVAFDERFEIKVSVKSDTQHVVPLTGSKFTPTVLAHMQENLTTL